MRAKAGIFVSAPSKVVMEKKEKMNMNMYAGLLGLCGVIFLTLINIIYLIVLVTNIRQCTIIMSVPCQTLNTTGTLWNVRLTLCMKYFPLPHVKLTQRTHSYPQLQSSYTIVWTKHQQCMVTTMYTLPSVSSFQMTVSCYLYRHCRLFHMLKNIDLLLSQIYTLKCLLKC